LIIEINTQSPTPIYTQLRDQIVLGIAGGRLLPGEDLPSVRRLAADLGINFHTVNKSYAMLSDEGYIQMDRRRGAVVAGGIARREAFEADLLEELTLSAAEAICHGISEMEFAALCGRAYQGAKNGGVSND